MPTDKDELVVRLDANFFDGTLANAVLLIADYLSDPVEHAALHEAAGRLKWAADRIEAADKRIAELEAENARLRRNIKGWVEWHRRCDAGDDCTYLNDNAWCDADALASTSMGLLARAALQQKERDDGPEPGSNEWLRQSPQFHPGDLA